MAAHLRTPLINQIRNRAKNTAYVKTLDGSANAANYSIELYNSVWSNQEQAREAVRMESRLELALEGHRFFNLVRWKKADEIISKYLEVEKTRRTHLSNASFIEGKNEYWPIPQAYIDGVDAGLVTQNNGY